MHELWVLSFSIPVIIFIFHL